MNKMLVLLFFAAIAFQASTAHPALEPQLTQPSTLPPVVVVETIGDATSSASQFLRNARTSVVNAIGYRVSDALSQLNGLMDLATYAINGARNLTNTFTNTQNAFGVQARATQTDLTNWLNSLTTTANNAATQIQNSASFVEATIYGSIDRVIGQLPGLYVTLTNEIKAAHTSGNAKGIACATIANNAIVSKIQQSANAFAACNGNAQKSLNSAMSTALAGITDQFNMAPTAHANIAKCISDYNANQNEVSAGAACLANVGVSALNTSTSAAIKTFHTTFANAADVIIGWGKPTGLQSCPNAVNAAAFAHSTATRTTFKQCLAA